MGRKLSPNVLVIGSGGREHALAWKLHQSKSVAQVYVAPGNGGTAEMNVPIRADDLLRLSQFAREKSCFTVVGPEGPLSLGIVDYFSKEGLPIFGPSKKEAMLETSKAYAKEFMNSHGIPTAQFGVFEDSQKAIDYAEKFQGNVAVKADGLAAGKGVIVCSSVESAREAVTTILDKRAFGEAGKTIVVEERLEGPECSVMTICDGSEAYIFGTAKDHKRALDNDVGPNTGGMGAYSPAAHLDTQSVSEIVKTIATPIVRASNFHGFLYLGLMLTSSGPKVLEFNVRLGDPETQAILPRLESDLFQVLTSVTEHSSLPNLYWSRNSSCTVVMCADGYPGTPRTGDRIEGIQRAEQVSAVTIFHSGTRKDGNDYYTNGGRVLGVTAVGPTLLQAVNKAYTTVPMISWNGEHHRSDIGRS